MSGFCDDVGGGGDGIEEDEMTLMRDGVDEMTALLMMDDVVDR